MFYFYLLFLFFFCFSFLNLIGWGGMMFMFSMNLSFLFFLMSIIILVFLNLTEINYFMLFMSKLVLIFTMFFFSVDGFFMFFMFYEMIMFPIFFMLFFYGSQPYKISAIYYAIIYTGVFSFPFMLIVINLEFWLFSFMKFSHLLGFFMLMLFLVKTPMFMMHFWLPKAHVEAPTSGSMLLAGILLKVGIYGLMKMMVNLNLNVCWFMYFSLLGLILSSFFCIFSSDSKVFAAYSSISHMNLVLYGLGLYSIFVNTGGLFVCVSHGYISSIMFCLIGIFYTNNGTRLIFYSSGLQSYSWLCILFSFMMLSNCSVPTMISFWGELIVFLFMMNYMFFLLFMLFLFFMYSFYYSIYYLMHMVKSGVFLNMNYMSLDVLFYMFFVCLNLFFFVF